MRHVDIHRLSTACFSLAIHSHLDATPGLASGSKYRAARRVGRTIAVAWQARRHGAVRTRTAVE